MRHAFLALFFILAACGGTNRASTAPTPVGGGGGLPKPDPLAATQPALTFKGTADFDPCFGGFCNYGLGQIGAADVYAMGAYGSGVVVAVIDTGVETTHTELDANISPDSIDIVRGGTLIDEDGHGTHVAGIIAAERNSLMTHGVAFKATILAIRADTRITDPAVCGSPGPCSKFDTASLIAGLNYAAGKAHVINLSLGVACSEVGGVQTCPALGPGFRNALIAAMNAGAIVAAAVGNDGSHFLQPEYPAAYAGNATVNARGQMIAVGAVDSKGVIAPFSNQCGSAMYFCLMAPGVEVWSTYIGGGRELLSGTSMATPHVSGAAALLVQLWPTLLPADVVNILLTTATDLGAPGVDPVYGRGLLNLSTAILPVGVLALPLTALPSGAGVPLVGTSLLLGPAFGDALANSPLLGRAFALDDYDRDYAFDLNQAVAGAPRGFGLEALLGGGSVTALNAELPNGMKIAMGVSNDDEAGSAADWAGMAAGNGEDRKLHGMSLEIESGPGATVRFGYDVTPAQQIAGLSASAPAALFWMAGDVLGPQHGLVGAGTGLSLSRRIGASSILSAGWVDQKDDLEDWGPDAKIGEITLAHRFGNGAVGHAGFSTVDEQGGFLGGSGAGGFAVAGADTRFFSLGGRYPLAPGLELIGNYTLGEADMRSGGTGLLGDWSEIRAEAFGIGLVKNGVLGRRDRIGLLAGQPLRVGSGEATVMAPVDYLADKTVVQGSERVSLAPTGREVDFQLAYDAPLGGSAALSGWVMMQLEPGHVAAADPAYGLGVRFSAGF